MVRMTEKHTSKKVLIGILVLLNVVAIGGATFYWLQNRTLRADFTASSTAYEATIETKNTELNAASNTIAMLTKEIKETSEDLEDLEDDYRDEKKKNDAFENQISSITGTIKDLDKLSKTDKELLQKYSKVYFLNENYSPVKLKQIDESYYLLGKDPMFFHANALSFLEDMIEDAKDDNIELKLVSAYRSFDHQEQLKGQFTTVYGNGANTFSADQGYSEHQLGTTVDITDPETAGTYENFKNTEAYEWLLDNAYKFGFVESYPEGNNYYVFEPWHWRFVGVDLAKDLHRADAHFYDWDQRKIDTYLLTIFD